MPVIANGRLITNYDPLSRMTLTELRTYERVLQEFMKRSSSPGIARRLQQIYEEIDWRAEDTQKRA